MNHDEKICEIIMKYSWSHITYGDLHRCKDIINQRWFEEGSKGRFLITQGSYFYTVTYGSLLNGMDECACFKCKTADEAPQALRKAIEYVLDNMGK